MIIKVDTRGSKEFYDELLFVTNNFKKFQKKPETKVQSLSKYIRNYMIYCCLAAILMAIFYVVFSNTIFNVLWGMFIILAVIYAFYLKSINDTLKAYLEDDSVKEIDINEEYIGYSDGTKTINTNWNEIQNIIITNNAIIFLPKGINNIVIAISTDYKDEVEEAIKFYNKDNLVIRK